MTNLDVAFHYLIEFSEGWEYVNDPDDPGGPTKFGITKKTYENFFGVCVPDREIELMSPAIAKQIYAAEYWAPLALGCVQNLGFAVAFFDTCVLYGVRTTGLMIQRALSRGGATLKLDGIIGDKSLGFINLAGGGSPSAQLQLMKAFQGQIMDRIDAVIVAKPTSEKYRRGWTNRADRLLNLLDEEYVNKLKNQVTQELS
ncbi:MAG: hypothetical protein OEW15_11720 [Nitrospirota bacterium]|nr:hypothetical protein [Nitrospirota bacterium]